MHEFAIEQIEVDAEGDVRPAALYMPVSDDPVAAVLLAPGGLAQGEIEAYTWAGEMLAGQGLACLILTYGAANPYGDASDVLAAFRRLDQVPGIRSESIGVIGHSRGGLGAIAAAAGEPRLRAVVALAAPADLAAYLEGLAGFFPAARGAIVQFMTGEPDAIPELYRSVNPLDHAAAIRQPVLLVHGTADMRVPFHHSQQLESVLLESGNSDVRLELIPGMGHYFELGTMGYQFDRIMSLIIDWLKERL